MLQHHTAHTTHCWVQSVHSAAHHTHCTPSTAGWAVLDVTGQFWPKIWSHFRCYSSHCSTASPPPWLLAVLNQQFSFHFFSEFRRIYNKGNHFVECMKKIEIYVWRERGEGGCTKSFQTFRFAALSATTWSPTTDHHPLPIIHVNLSILLFFSIFTFCKLCLLLGKRIFALFSNRKILEEHLFEKLSSSKE